MTGRHNSSGFTLLEVMVALAVLALALGAIIQSIGSSTGNIAHLRNKTFAHWVAMNRVSEYQAKQVFPPLGNNDGNTEMAGHEWYWKETVKEAPMSAGEITIENVRRIDIEVRANRTDKKPLVTLNTFIGKSAQ